MGVDFTETVKPLQLPFIVSGVYLNGAGVRNARMDVYQTRKGRLRQFVARFEKQSDAAERLGRSPTQLSQLLGKKKNIGAWLARELEKLAGDPPGSWDFPQEPPAVNEPGERYGSEYLYVGRVDGPRLSAGRGEVIWDSMEPTEPYCLIPLCAETNQHSTDAWGTSSRICKRKPRMRSLKQ